MAIIYRATIQPTKLELLGRWLPTQPWFTGDAVEPTALGAYRFDDPAGEVGVEAHLVSVADGPALHVPLTYRGAELAGADDALLGTMEHSVLGRRWVYDGCADPVYISALAHALFGRGEQAIENLAGTDESRRPTAVVRGSGEPAPMKTYSDVEYAPDGDRTLCTVEDAEIEVVRVIDSAGPVAGDHTLTGTWGGQSEPVLLARGQRHFRPE